VRVQGHLSGSRHFDLEAHRPALAFHAGGAVGPDAAAERIEPNARCDAFGIGVSGREGPDDGADQDVAAVRSANGDAAVLAGIDVDGIDERDRLLANLAVRGALVFAPDPLGCAVASSRLVRRLGAVGVRDLGDHGRRQADP